MLDEVCIMASGNATISSTPGAGFQCTTNQQYVETFYDTNGDDKVSVSEFHAALRGKLGKCCSASCPQTLMSGFANQYDCSGVEYDVFPAVASASEGTRCAHGFSSRAD